MTCTISYIYIIAAYFESSYLPYIRMLNVARGSFSHVFLCIHASSQKYAVVKYYPKEYIYHSQSLYKIQKVCYIPVCVSHFILY